MNIIILAAGRGTRLMPLTRNTPKPLIDVGNGKTLIEEQLEQIQKCGNIKKAILVTGYLASQIDSKMKSFNKNISLSTVYNPFFDTSNNLISLWLAKHEMNDDFLVTNGDNIFHADIFKEITSIEKDGIYLSINYKDDYVDDDMKVTLENSSVKYVSKEIPKEKTDCESVGLALVRGGKYRQIFINALEALVRNNEYINKFWLETFNTLVQSGVTIETYDIKDDTRWKEVDFHLDLENIRNLLKI